VTTFELRTTSPRSAASSASAALRPRVPDDSQFIAGVFFQRRLIRDSFLTSRSTRRVSASSCCAGAADAAAGSRSATREGRFLERSTLVTTKRRTRSPASPDGLHFLPRWTLTAGMRLQNETKAATGSDC